MNTEKPRSVNLHDEIFMLAVANGCEPEWLHGLYGWGWHCSCPGNDHGCDQECSTISLSSASQRDEEE